MSKTRIMASMAIALAGVGSRPVAMAQAELSSAAPWFDPSAPAATRTQLFSFKPPE